MCILDVIGDIRKKYTPFFAVGSNEIAGTNVESGRGMS